MEGTVFGISVFSTVISLISGTCTSGQYIVNPTLVGKRYPGTVFMTFENVGHNECFDECIRRPLCKSFNYKNTEYLCQLNSGFGVKNNDYDTDAKFDYTSMDGLRKTFYDPCMYVGDCVPGTVCIRHTNGTKQCIMEDPTAYQEYLDSIQTTTSGADTTTDVTNGTSTSEVTTTRNAVVSGITTFAAEVTTTRNALVSGITTSTAEVTTTRNAVVSGITTSAAEVTTNQAVGQTDDSNVTTTKSVITTT